MAFLRNMVSVQRPGSHPNYVYLEKSLKIWGMSNALLRSTHFISQWWNVRAKYPWTLLYEIIVIWNCSDAYFPESTSHLSNCCFFCFGFPSMIFAQALSKSKWGKMTSLCGLIDRDTNTQKATWKCWIGMNCSGQHPCSREASPIVWCGNPAGNP